MVFQKCANIRERGREEGERQGKRGEEGVERAAKRAGKRKGRKNVCGVGKSKKLPLFLTPACPQGYWQRPEATGATIDTERFLHTGEITLTDCVCCVLRLRCSFTCISQDVSCHVGLFFHLPVFDFAVVFLLHLSRITDKHFPTGDIGRVDEDG